MQALMPKMTTYLLIQTEIGRVVEAAQMLRALAGATAVEVVEGPFDIVARTEDEGTEARLMSRCATKPFLRVLPCRVRDHAN
jgi:hypothetical protein